MAGEYIASTDKEREFHFMPMPRNSCWRWTSSSISRVTTLTSMGTSVWLERLALASRTAETAIQCLLQVIAQQWQFLHLREELWAEGPRECGPGETLCEEDNYFKSHRKMYCIPALARFSGLQEKNLQIYKQREWPRDCNGLEERLLINYL